MYTRPPNWNHGGRGEKAGWQARENGVTRSRREGNPRWKTKGSRGEPPCGHARHSPLFLRDAFHQAFCLLVHFFSRPAIDHTASYRDATSPRLHRDAWVGRVRVDDEPCGPIDYRHFVMYENVSNGSDRKIQ